MQTDLQTVIERIQKSKTPIDEVGDIVLEKGGFWNPTEAADPTKLFTIHLLGIQGNGIGSAAALDDWLRKAAKELRDLATLEHSN
jgi:hypothetical protein